MFQRSAVLQMHPFLGRVVFWGISFLAYLLGSIVLAFTVRADWPDAALGKAILGATRLPASIAASPFDDIIPAGLVGILVTWPLFFPRHGRTAATASLIVVLLPALVCVSSRSANCSGPIGLPVIWLAPTYWLSIPLVYFLRVKLKRETWYNGTMLGLIPHGLVVLFGEVTGFVLFFFGPLYFALILTNVAWWLTGGRRNGGARPSIL